MEVVMGIENYSTVELLREITKREKVTTAPHRVSRSTGWKEWTVGVGKDEIAYITMHEDALSELLELTNANNR